MTKILSFPTDGANDTAAREAALNTRASCIVEAPAGSGKTGLLMQRYLKLLTEDSVQQPEEVLAITFTNKATAELRERILTQLEAASHATPLPADASPFDRQTRDLAAAVITRDADFGWQILARPHRLNIRTIDALCSQIASSVPLLSGSAPRKPVTDAHPLYRRAAKRTLMLLGSSNTILHQSLRTVLLHRDANLADVETLLANMLAQREQWGEIIPFTPGELTDQYLDEVIRLKLERSLEFLVCSALTRATQAMPPGLLEELTQLAARLGLEPGYKGAPSPLAICATRNRPPQAVADDLDHWLANVGLLLKPSDGEWRVGFAKNHIGFEIRKADAAHLKDLVASIQSDPLKDALQALRSLPPTRYPDDQWRVTKALFHILRHALAELHLLFAEAGECDFTELALSAREALSSEDSATDLALATGGNLRHLLVDEMQDTSAGQYELIHLLTRNWDGATQTLFLVGDPKQSIYLFRQARVERFLRTMHEHRLGDIPLQSLILTSNFRSQQTLVQHFNDTFEPLFPSADQAQERPSEVPFVAAVATRKSTGTHGIEWHPAILTDRYTAADHVRTQARDIVETIQYWQTKPLPPGRVDPWRIAILARARAHLAPTVAELKRSGVQYRAVDIDPLTTVPEVLDVLALTRALLHPADRVAWLSVLHAPWCGLGLADLLLLTGEDADPDAAAPVTTLLRKRSDRLSEDAQQRLSRAWPLLESAIAGIGQTPLDVHIERTWLSLGGDLALSEAQLANVRRYLRLLREVQAEPGPFSLSTLTSHLKTLYAEPATGEIHVELLTIHKAKGLEWDVVLVPSLEKTARNPTSDLLNWLEIDGTPDDASPVLLAPIHSKGLKADALNRWMSAARGAREESERRRLFYVLCTRAREELHLFGAVSMTSSGELGKPAHGSLLKSAWPAAQQTFTQIHLIQLDVMQNITDYPEVEDSEASYLDIAAATSASFPQPTIERLPLSIQPLSRFEPAPKDRLNYPSGSAILPTPAFDRPEGSFAARAFGNVVHRYLQVLSQKLEAGVAADSLLADLPQWEPRLRASLRGEGIPPSLADRESHRALQALVRALNDASGRWILSPHSSSASEQAVATPAGTLRADRTFVAGPEPLSSGSSHIWIIDYKTTEQGSRTDEAFKAAELAKYRDQLEIYAERRRSLPGGDAPVMLGLYFPLIPRLIFWHSDPKSPTTTDTL